jgi:hypothetical protein
MAVRVVVAVFALALVAPAASAPSASTPRATILQQVSFFRQGKWRAMYATYTARFRRSCPYRRFVRAQLEARQILGTNVQVRGIRVRNETARRALIAYTVVRNGQTLGRVTFADRDVYLRVGSGWFDDLDRVSTCS